MSKPTLVFLPFPCPRAPRTACSSSLAPTGSTHRPPAPSSTSPPSPPPASMPAHPAVSPPLKGASDTSRSRAEQLEDALAGPQLDGATSATRDDLRRLARYTAPPSDFPYPKKKLAAVLVLLHLNPRGELSVTLTTRSQKLRSHPGETALPGGRWEEGDGESGEWTALREANEEVALSLPPSSTSIEPSHLLHLTTLPAFTSRTLLVVLPVVYLLLHPASSASSYLSSTLKASPAEVAAIFHLPLRAFLLLLPPSLPSDYSDDSQAGAELLSHSYTDHIWLDRPYRLHSFAHSLGSAVTGLTADIVIETVRLAAGLREEELSFERNAEGQMGWGEIVDVAMRTVGERGIEKKEQEGDGAVQVAA